jgi:anti-sigma regulatory factor (Ser/Thr protein kinase)
MKRRLDLALTADPAAAKRLRNELHAWLLDAGINGISGDLALAATEAFANAVEHPLDRRSKRISVTGTISEDQIVLRFRDDGRWRKTRKDCRGHYGLSLIETLTDTVEVVHTTGGTVVTLRKRL